MKLLLILTMLFSLNYAGQVVVNKDAGVSSMNVDDVKNVFNLKKLEWANGKKVIVYILPAVDGTQEQFASKTLGSNANAVYEQWIAYVLNGGANTPPKTVNERKMSKFLKSKSGSIGILPDGAALPENTVSVLKF